MWEIVTSILFFKRHCYEYSHNYCEETSDLLEKQQSLRLLGVEWLIILSYYICGDHTIDIRYIR